MTPAQLRLFGCYRTLLLILLLFLLLLLLTDFSLTTPTATLAVGISLPFRRTYFRAGHDLEMMELSMLTDSFKSSRLSIQSR